MAERTLDDLRQKQALPLNVKVRLTMERIRQWVNEYGEDSVYVSFSGGKDSTVLLDIVRNLCGYKDIPAVFIDVPTQYPELRTFAQSFENVVTIKPKISFVEVCKTYGFPLISKEVSECVQGARKYLRKIVDRQTDRQSIPYRYFYDKLSGEGRYRKSKEPHKGGWDNKYRKLRGLSEYSRENSEGGAARTTPERLQNLMGWRTTGELHPNESENGSCDGSVQRVVCAEEGDYP